MLPEAQLDRFMLKIGLGYPDAATEKSLLRSHSQGQPADQLQPVTTMEEIAAIQQEIRDVYISEALADYLLDIVRRTREHQDVLLGASPRASLAFVAAAKAYAFCRSGIMYCRMTSRRSRRTYLATGFCSVRNLG